MTAPAVLALGELLVDFVSQQPGVTLGAARSFLKAAGGAPANVAVGVARLGVPSGFIGKVGDDPFGRHLADVLRAEGVDVRQLVFDPEARTALAFVSLTQGGERDFMFYRHPSADMRHRPDEIDDDAIRASRVLHVGSISLIGESSARATRHAVAVAREAGTLVSYDPNLRLPLWTSPDAAADAIRSLLPLADVVKVSDEELRFLTGRDDDAAARSLWHEGLQLLLVTRGAEGVTYLLRDGAGSVPGFEVDTRDTTGAGDAFDAAVLAALVESPSLLSDRAALEAALRRANAFAALTTTRPGAIPALPTRAELERFLAEHDALERGS
jgi:fructokinase